MLFKCIDSKSSLSSRESSSSVLIKLNKSSSTLLWARICSGNISSSSSSSSSSSPSSFSSFSSSSPSSSSSSSASFSDKSSFKSSIIKSLFPKFPLFSKNPILLSSSNKFGFFSSLLSSISISFFSFSFSSLFSAIIFESFFLGSFGSLISF